MPDSIKTWSSHFYNANTETILDKSALEIDLIEGNWIRCGPCRGRKYITRPNFSLSAWRSHKKSKSHQLNYQKYFGTVTSRPVIRQEVSVEEIHSESTGSDAMRDLFLNKLKHFLQNDALAKRTIGEIAFVLADQQRELWTATERIEDIAKVIESVAKETEKMHETLRWMNSEPFVVHNRDGHTATHGTKSEESDDLFELESDFGYDESDEMSMFENHSQLQDE